MTLDEKLLDRYASDRSDAAFAAIVRRYHGFVYSVCCRTLGDAELAEDVTQAVFMLLASKAASLRRGTPLSGWLFNTARFACRNARRTEQRRVHYEQKRPLPWKL